MPTPPLIRKQKGGIATKGRGGTTHHFNATGILPNDLTIGGPDRNAGYNQQGGNANTGKSWDLEGTKHLPMQNQAVGMHKG